MRPFTALLILVACQCLHGHQYSRTSRHFVKDTLHELLEKQSKPVRRIVTCTRTLGVPKCISALGVWRAECALRAFHKDPAASFNLTKDVEKFSWERYSNVTDEELQTQLLDKTEKLLQYRSLNFNMIPGYTAKLISKSNGSVSFDIDRIDEVESRSSIKKFQKQLYEIMPFIFAPGLIITALVPFILPSLKMMILMVGLVNKIALAGAIFTILRNNAFSPQTNHKIVYVNAGYENEKIKLLDQPANNEEHFHTDHLGIFYDDSKAHVVSARPNLDVPFDEGFETIEEIAPLSVSPQWIKEYTDNKLLSDQPNANYYFNGPLPIRRSKKDAPKASS